MLLLAAGRGVRFGGDCPKAWAMCAGKSLVQRSVERLVALRLPGEIILAVHADDRAKYVAPAWPELSAAGVTKVVDGGASRQESMQRALDASDPGCALVLVHDAARPLFPLAPTREAVERAAQHGAALLAVPLADTLKRVAGDGRVIQTVERRGLWLAQTPQVAQRDLLERALADAIRDGVEATDDMALLERAGAHVEVVMGSPHNLKVTTPADLAVIEHLALSTGGDSGP